MPRSPAPTPDAYLAALPPERRMELAAVRDLVRRNLPQGYEETMSLGMIAWVIPLERYPKTYNGHALWYAALAAQRNFSTLYLMSAYGDSQQYKDLKAAFAKAGKKFDMGKSCLHFKRAEDLDLDAVGRAIASTPPDDFIALYEKGRRR